MAEARSGARALVTEEGVSAVVFDQARDFDMLETSKSAYGLLRTIRGMVAPFEVRSRSLADWDETIIASYRVWREAINHRGGTVIGDAEARTLDFQPPTW